MGREGSNPSPGTTHGDSYAAHVPADLEPPALARLVDFAERPRTDDWSLRAPRSSATRSPNRSASNDLLDLVRRLDSALGRYSTVLQRDGDAVWAVLDGGGKPADERQARSSICSASRRSSTVSATCSPSGPSTSPATRPDDAVDDVIDEIGAQLDALGVPHEERPPNRQRGV